MICIYRLGKVEIWEYAGTRASPNRVVIAAKTFLMERFTGSQSFSALKNRGALLGEVRPSPRSASCWRGGPPPRHHPGPWHSDSRAARSIPGPSLLRFDTQHVID